MHSILWVLAICGSRLWRPSRALLSASATDPRRAPTCATIADIYALESLIQRCLLPYPEDYAAPVKIATPSGGSANALGETAQPASDLTTETKPIALDLPPPTAALSDADADLDILSDNTDFLSFEQWKAQMLQKGGQSPENVRGVRDGTQRPDTRQRPGNLHSALDSIGDDTEIDLGIDGSDARDGSETPPKPQDEKSEDNAKAAGEPEQKMKHSKEAGTTSKERFNYASFDCAATVLKTNTECKGPSSVLVENKDTYMLSTCSAKNRFLIVELCNDILIDTIVLGNFEFFSSTFRTFRVSISDRYPVKIDKWRELGTFEAQNTRAIQAFLIENGLIWARYLRIEFLSHYGSEYYCPVSLLRVHGKTMMDDYLNEVKASRGEDDGDDDEEATVEAAQSHTSTSPEPTLPTDAGNSTSSSSTNETVQSIDQMTTNDTCSSPSHLSPLAESADLLHPTCAANSSAQNEVSSRSEQSSGTIPIDATAQTTSSSTSHSQSINSAANFISTAIEVKASSSANPIVATSSPSPTPSNATADASPTASLTKLATSTTTSTTAIKSTADSQRPRTPSSANNFTAPTPPRPSTPSSPSPTTQDSFFKSVHKRLLQLESNATLSMQYIEEQSRLLRDALTRAERRQRARTGAFFERWNRTVRAELQDALQHQAEQARRDLAAMKATLRQERDDFAAHAAAELRMFRYLVGLQAALLVALSVGFAWFMRRAATNAYASTNGVAKAPPRRRNSRPRSAHRAPPRAAHFRDDSGDWSSRPSTPPAPPPRAGSRPGSRYGRLTPLRSLMTECSRPSSRGSTEGGCGKDGAGKGPDDADGTGLLTPTASDREGERPRSAPGEDAVLRRTWSTPAFAELGDVLGREEGGEFAFRRGEGS